MVNEKNLHVPFNVFHTAGEKEMLINVSHVSFFFFLKTILKDKGGKTLSITDHSHPGTRRALLCVCVDPVTLVGAIRVSKHLVPTWGDHTPWMEGLHLCLRIKNPAQLWAGGRSPAGAENIWGNPAQHEQTCFGPKWKLLSSPICIRCSNFVCYFCLDFLLCSEMAWYLHEHKLAFKAQRRKRSGTTWWSPGLGEWPRRPGPGGSPVRNENRNNQGGNQLEIREKQWTWRWLPPSFLRKQSRGTTTKQEDKPRTDLVSSTSQEWEGKKGEGAVPRREMLQVRATKCNLQAFFGFWLNKSTLKKKKGILKALWIWTGQ